jgi:hypothetical protein
MHRTQCSTSCDEVLSLNCRAGYARRTTALVNIARHAALVLIVGTLGGLALVAMLEAGMP